MARKKKTETKEVSQPIKYKGEVSVKVVRGNRVYSSKTFKNNGYVPMSYFFACCLAQDYITAEIYRPKYIRLFTLGTSGVTSVPSDETALLNKLTDTNEVLVIPSMYDTTPSIIKDTKYYKTTIKFLIPFTQIKSGMTDNINGLCLYCSSKYNNLNEPSAYFVVVDSDDNTKLGSLIDTSGITPGKEDEFNIQIQWTLSVN